MHSDTIIAIVFFVFGAALLCIALATRNVDDLALIPPNPHKLMHRPREQSWDQENLQKLSFGKPCVAVYDAPNGFIHQCL